MLTENQINEFTLNAKLCCHIAAALMMYEIDQDICDWDGLEDENDPDAALDSFQIFRLNEDLLSIVPGIIRKGTTDLIMNQAFEIMDAMGLYPVEITEEDVREKFYEIKRFYHEAWSKRNAEGAKSNP